MLFRSQNVTSKSRMPQGLSALPVDDIGEDDINSNVFSTDLTLALMLQLREILLISHAQGWHIFDEKVEPYVVL